MPAYVCARARVQHVCVYLSRRAGCSRLLPPVFGSLFQVENSDSRGHHIALRIDDDGAVRQEVEGELTEGFFVQVVEDREDVDLHVAVFVELGFLQDLRYVLVRGVGGV